MTVVDFSAAGILRRALDNALFAAALRLTLLIAAPFGYTHVAKW